MLVVHRKYRAIPKIKAAKQTRKRKPAAPAVLKAQPPGLTVVKSEPGIQPVKKYKEPGSYPVGRQKKKKPAPVREGEKWCDYKLEVAIRKARLKRHAKAIKRAQLLGLALPIPEEQPVVKMKVCKPEPKKKKKKRARKVKRTRCAPSGEVRCCSVLEKAIAKSKRKKNKAIQQFKKAHAQVKNKMKVNGLSIVKSEKPAALVNEPFNTYEKMNEVLFTPLQNTRFLEGLRWPNGIYCAHCESIDYSQPKEGKYICNVCHQKFDVFTGSVFDNRRTSHKTIVHVVFHETNLNGGAAVNELLKYVPSSPKTIRDLLSDTRLYAYDQSLVPYNLTATASDIYILDTSSRNGKNSNRHDGKKHNHADYLGSQKGIFLTIRYQGGKVWTFEIPDEKRETMEKIIREVIPSGATVVTDEAAALMWLGEFYRHIHINHSAKQYGIYDEQTGMVMSTNVIEGFNSFFKTGVMKFRNNIPKKRLKRFLNAAAYRYNTSKLSVYQRMCLAFKNIFRHAERALRKQRQGKQAQTVYIEDAIIMAA